MHSDSIFLPPILVARINLRTKMSDYVKSGLVSPDTPVYIGPDGSVAIGKDFGSDPEYGDYIEAGTAKDYIDN